MTPDESVRIIQAAGGTRQFAELIGICEDPYYKQRIYNWKRRGIPSRVELQNQAVIQKLAKQKTNA